MRRNHFKPLVVLLLLFIGITALIACRQSDEAVHRANSAISVNQLTQEDDMETSDADNNNSAFSEANMELVVRFGDEGNPFVLYLYDNETAAAIANYVGTTEWRLPIYHYDDYENWEIMQYYDIPRRYTIPSNPEDVTSEPAGTVYYSDPNRIVLFYGDGQVHAEYTPIGYFNVTDEFISAVENNPVLRGWGNKIVLISNGE